MRAGAAIVLAVALSSCGSGGARSAAPRRVPEVGGLVASNVLREDYAGSAACTPCHRELAERFASSPMRRMTREIAGTDVRAPFGGESLRFRDDVLTMETLHGDRFVRLETPRGPPSTWRVTKVIGGRRREDFAGLFVASTREGAAAGTREEVLPVSFVFATEEWRYKGYSVMTPERPYAGTGPVWSQTCILCHNTAPHLVSIYDDLVGDGAPKYQGSLHGNLLPGDRRWVYEVRDGATLARAVRDELARLGDDAPPASLQTTLVRAIGITWRDFDARHLVEEGVGCEACHNGSREHAGDPRILPTFALRGAVSFGPASGAPTEAALVNRTCARCHSVLFSGYPRTWEGGDRDGAPGGAHINSGEARDFLLGGCSDAMACTRCHDAHGHDAQPALDRIASSAGNAICTECHTELAGGAAFRAHAHHEPSGAAGACVSCHMPRKNMGLGFRLTRYHRIGSPTDEARVYGDRPLECALCHADRSVSDLVSSMERWWGRRYDRARLEALYGGLDANVIDATLARGAPHEVAVAVAVAAEAGDRRRAPAIARQLGNEIPLVRYWARESLTVLEGARPDLDMSAPGPELEAAGRAWLASRTGADSGP